MYVGSIASMPTYIMFFSYATRRMLASNRLAAHHTPHHRPVSSITQSKNNANVFPAQTGDCRPTFQFLLWLTSHYPVCLRCTIHTCSCTGTWTIHSHKFTCEIHAMEIASFQLPPTILVWSTSIHPDCNLSLTICFICYVY